MKKEQPTGHVNKLHLIYIIICLSVVIVAILTIAIWSKEDASTGLNNAATASSIVLAVVAIVMTIVDVAGQRKTVADLKDTAETLGKNLEQANEGIVQIGALKDELLNSMNALQKNYDEITQGISSIQQKYESEDVDKGDELIEDLEQIKYKIINPADLQPVKFVRRSSGYFQAVSRYQDMLDEKNIKSFEIRQRIREVLRDGKEHSISELMGDPGIQFLKTSTSDLKQELKGLELENVINNNDSKYSLRVKTE